MIFDHTGHKDPLSLDDRDPLYLRYVIENIPAEREEAARILLAKIAAAFNAGQPVDERALKSVEKIEELRADVLVFRLRMKGGTKN